MKKEGSNRQLIGSLVKGLNVLDILMDCGEVGVTELSNMLGINKSNAYRLLNTLEEQGYVEQDDRSEKYKLGMKFARLKIQVLGDAEIQTMARTYLDRLTNETKESSTLCVFANDTGILVGKQSSSETISANCALGMNEPLYCTALGKALLAYLPQSEQERLLKTMELKPLTPKTFVTSDQLMADLRKVVATGVAIDDEEYSLGMRCLASPVFDAAGKLEASIGISGPITRVRTDILNDYIEIVRKVAMDFSKQLGYSPSHTLPCVKN